MISYTFKIEKEKFERRKLTEIQHKLRVALKCYTVKDFKLSSDSNEYEFIKTMRLNKIQVVSPNVLKGNYVIEDLDDTMCKVTLNVLL